ncbi:hypothetical protein Tph_c05580 [Thermacetogenium phaeum DSM 12270]|jgi:hypothetical protein|uniref:HepT-like domain-containing protein n=1 Tax=Thermacetogenium phaeum (strain ATCC BAA-254 / DSM 26808 / PB) TaxID=1089553 RepID=K4LCZ4_THEPS|nr:hypothetical protein [Thermacetogenium phaeum]AFV10796.1 hypothetical protein Tph_c05580 [Thermacetogenium phaeum DSM 12270]
MTIEEFLLVKAKIKRELENISLLEDELAGYKLFPVIETDSLGGFYLEDNAACRIIGSILHDYYVAVENIFKAVARRIDGVLLAGEQWHKELLEQMTLDVPGIRPPLLSGETSEKLDKLRGFRHVFRNVYGFNLASERIRELLAELPVTSSYFKRDVDDFIKKMEKLLFQ